MEGTKKNEEMNKTAGDSTSHQGTASNTPETVKGTGITGNASGTTGAGKTSAGDTAHRQPAAKSTSGSVPGPAGEKMTEPDTAQPPEKQADAAAVTGEPASTARKSKKIAKAIRKLKKQKKEVASLEKKRENLVKDLVAAIEKGKKSKQIMSMAQEFRRYEKQTRNKTKAYLRAKKNLAKKMQ